jgi:hypothetical protein
MRFLFFFANLVLLASCGARTELWAPEIQEAGADSQVDATMPVGCVPGDIPLTVATPEVLFVLDRSGSMSTPFDGPQTRWQTLTSALAATLPAVDTSMAIGGYIFPSTTSSNDCSVPSAANLVPAKGNVQSLLSIMQSMKPGGETPTADAIQGASALLLSERAATTARALVLATDGAPNCNAALDPKSCICSNKTCKKGEQCLDATRTVQRIAAVFAQGVPTYVIGIQNDGSQFATVLDAMAQAGGRPLTNAPQGYYPARSQADLETAISTIRDQVSACTYLTTSVPSADGSIVVTLNGQVIPFDPNGTSGWKWASETNGQIILLGTTCAAAAGGSNTLIAHVQCDVADAGDDASDAFDGSAD